MAQAAFLPILLAGVSAAGTVAALVDRPKAPVVPPPVSLNQAQQQQNAQDSLLGRMGSAADMLTGPNGAQPMMPGPKTLLGN
ncbi:hypothetical protein [Novosphingobium sp. FSW06-99]|uniref:hypothetical protein n=1 Tax=Novosphingobium sp. FSW06-99 TaxID=1739113 RepID=UPI000A97396B|nr:hypothetical protein [Novosphingobium sp. FSW06-99]